MKIMEKAMIVTMNRVVTMIMARIMNDSDNDNDNDNDNGEMATKQESENDTDSDNGHANSFHVNHIDNDNG